MTSTVLDVTIAANEVLPLPAELLAAAS